MQTQIFMAEHQVLYCQLSPKPNADSFFNSVFINPKQTQMY